MTHTERPTLRSVYKSPAGNTKESHPVVVTPFVIVFALDFSKAFDTVRHATLLRKVAMPNSPDAVYNKIVEFSGRSHCTRYRGSTSALLDISSSIIQGSAIGPVSFVVNAGDLTTVTPGNQIHKYADDTRSFVVIPACNAHSRADELQHVAIWAQTNNLKLNMTKSVEIIVTHSRRQLQNMLPTRVAGHSLRYFNPRTWHHTDKSSVSQRPCP